MLFHFPTIEILIVLVPSMALVILVHWLFFSESAKKHAQNKKTASGLPLALKKEHPLSSYLGWEENLRIPIYLPDQVRSRHVHVLGTTGSGKTESVLLNLIDQDARRGFPIVIVDAKGEESFIRFLKDHPRSLNKLNIFDVDSQKESFRYNPLGSGNNTDAVLRLFNSMVWSDEFYKTRCRDTLMRLADSQTRKDERVTLHWLNEALASASSLAAHLTTDTKPLKITEQEYSQLAGLVSQVNQLCYGELGNLISGESNEKELNLSQAILNGEIIYFKLPALIDPVTTATIGRLIIGDLALHAANVQSKKIKGVFTPVFLDEFGSLVCPAFLELIAKARSAGLALHFSHQSMGDLKAAGDNYVSQINDNSSTKIVLRVHDPDTADNIARMFGTVITKKATKQVVTSLGSQSETGVMAVRDTREFRCNPDELKSLNTGHAFVLMNHSLRSKGSSGDVFQLHFPRSKNYQKKEN